MCVYFLFICLFTVGEEVYTCTRFHRCGFCGCHGHATSVLHDHVSSSVKRGKGVVGPAAGVLTSETIEARTTTTHCLKVLQWLTLYIMY